MTSSVPPVGFWRRCGRALLWSLVVVLAVLAARYVYVVRDRTPGYRLALNLPSHGSPPDRASLRVGFGRARINPDLSDPDQPVWLAGFAQHRAATRLHDDLWAVACVLDDGRSRLGIVALDAIGFFHDDVVAVRRRLPGDWKIDYAVVCSTHNHNTPDLIGLWGPNYARTGVNARYREQVIAGAVVALGQAAANLQPARVAFHEIPTPPAGLVTDTRKPHVFDSDLRVMHFTLPGTGATIGTIVGWANHPETVWAKNTEITADFPGYLRDVLENGVHEHGAMLEPGVGGIHLYVNGAIGGLMTTSPRITVRDPYLEQDFQEPTHAKARALGRALAARILPQLEATNARTTDRASLGLQARTIPVPLTNKAYLLAGILGLLDRGHVGWQTVRTEVALLTLGEASIACIPGEIYPELVNGGIERAPGGDFELEPVEVPPIREMMPGRIKFIFGLANDEIGYIIPKSEWDQRPPYLYDAKKAPYGEINSVGPEAASRIHEALRDMCRTAQADAASPRSGK